MRPAAVAAPRVRVAAGLAVRSAPRPAARRPAVAVRLAASAALAALAALASIAPGYGCGSGGGGGSSGDGGSGGGAPAGAQTAPLQGRLEVLTYNVAGLPDFLSGSNPRVNTPQISPLLNAYELVLVQEDFWYHTQLEAQTVHPYRSPTMTGQSSIMPDGLNFFSFFELSGLDRQRWSTCHGVYDAANDCLADKGFARVEVKLAEGVTLDVYNLHADAGGSANDRTARSIQLQQLAAYIQTHSAGRPLLVGGDYNLHGADPGDEPILQAFMAAAGLADACRTVACGAEHIDRILFRSAPSLTIAPVGWRVATEFVDASGAPLSDHPAIHVTFAWSTR